MAKKKERTFSIECPICKMKHKVPAFERGRFVTFVCSDELNKQGVGCKSVITVRVEEKEYEEK